MPYLVRALPTLIKKEGGMLAQGAMDPPPYLSMCFCKRKKVARQGSVGLTARVSANCWVSPSCTLQGVQHRLLLLLVLEGRAFFMHCHKLRDLQVKP
eukprot:scaffold145887_cov13-Tisochrysis_lutea.AAC.2